MIPLKRIFLQCLGSIFKGAGVTGFRVQALQSILKVFELTRPSKFSI